MEKDKRLMEASWWERLRGKQGLVLMGGAVLSKSLIQFSVDGQGCILSLLFDLRLNYDGSNKDNGDSFKKSHARTAALNVPNPAAGHRQPTPPPETPGHPQARLGQSLVGSLLLSPGSWCTEAFVWALLESVPQACVSSGGSLVELMATSSKRAYAIPRSTFIY